MADALPLASSPRADPQHRHHGPHRRGQDHHHRAHPLLHGQQLQDRRGPRRRRHHGLDGPGARARASPSPLRPRPARGTTTRSTSSTPPATSTSPSRSSARCASSTAPSRSSTPSPASSPRPRPCGARPTSTGAADLLREQDGPRRRELRALRRDDHGPPRLRPRRHPAAHRRRDRVPRRGRPLGMRALVWEEGMGEECKASRDPRATWPTRPRSARHQLIDVLSELRRQRHGEVPCRGGDHRRRPQARRCGPATLASACVPILCGSAFKNKGVQPMLDAVVDFLPSPLDLPPTAGTKPGKDEEIEREARRRRAVLAPWRSRS